MVKNIDVGHPCKPCPLRLSVKFAEVGKKQDF